ncbi:MAG TPA: P-loop NTPase fold protein [Candidatus Sulfotelmatobacter sp.]|nr:P-loop NTPase fold protein [Candidatus Sulfotelmatobacter sp.]
MSDFLSQASFEAGIALPKDALDHDDIAASILTKSGLLPPGSVLCIQGPWGRGKTDVLARVATATYKRHSGEHLCPKAIWVNPWQYGTPDLLSPIVLALLERIKPEHRTASKAIRMAAETIIKAGLSFGLKATALMIPGGKIYEAAAKEAKDLLQGLFEARDVDESMDKRPDPDPVSQMGLRFSQLVEEVLDSEGFDDSVRLLVCIDDLDRCLPHRQVALLESIRFLLSAGARASFIVALDPSLARQSVIAHFGTDIFDPDRYLDKMFDLRVGLPSLSDAALDSLFRSQLSSMVGMPVGSVPLEKMLSQQFGNIFSDWANVASNWLLLPDFRNPRMVHRTYFRAHPLAGAIGRFHERRDIRQ